MPQIFLSGKKFDSIMDTLRKLEDGVKYLVDKQTEIFAVQDLHSGQMTMHSNDIIHLRKDIDLHTRQLEPIIRNQKSIGETNNLYPIPER